MRLLKKHSLHSGKALSSSIGVLSFAQHVPLPFSLFSLFSLYFSPFPLHLSPSLFPSMLPFPLLTQISFDLKLGWSILDFFRFQFLELNCLLMDTHGQLLLRHTRLRIIPLIRYVSFLSMILSIFWTSQIFCRSFRFSPILMALMARQPLQNEFIGLFLVLERPT